MDSNVLSGPGAPSHSPRGERLESWKEIAAYLRRDVRTVQRWERGEGLPVHRHVHNKLATVYGYRHELDQWLAARGTLPNNGASAGASRRVLYLSAAAALLAATALSYGTFHVMSRSTADVSRPDRTEGSPASIAIRRVWTGVGVLPLMTVSADGRFAAFPEPETGYVTLHDLADGRTRAIRTRRSAADTSGGALQPVLSPDATQIAFAWRRADAVYELRATSVDDDLPTVLYQDEQSTYLAPAGWSADRRRVLFVMTRKDGTSQIAIVSTADRSLLVLKTISKVFPTARLSPDGQFVVCDYPAAADSSQHDIFLLPSTGGAEAPLVEHPANDYVLGWTADGRAILFASDRLGTMDLWMVRVTDGKRLSDPALIKKDLGRITPAGLTSQGSFYYAVAVNTSDVYTAALNRTNGRLLAPPEPVARDAVGLTGWPDWSPDGGRLAYITRSGRVGDRDRRLAITIRDANGPVRHIALERAFRQIYRLRWSPDARLLLANGTDSDGRFGIYTIAVATGEVRAIENGDRVWGRDPFPQWSSDGRTVLFHAREPNGDARGLFARDLTTGRERRVDDLAGSLLADRRRLEPQKLDLEMPGIREVRVRADGSRVAFFVERTAAELWVMENFLPRTIARRR